MNTLKKEKKKIVFEDYSIYPTGILISKTYVDVALGILRTVC